MAYISPLICAFIADDDVEDNNGTIPGYGTVNAQSRINNVFNSISKTATGIYESIMTILGILLKIFIHFNWYKHNFHIP